jgi:hypothetical protein
VEQSPKDDTNTSPQPEGFSLPAGFVNLGQFELFTDGEYSEETSRELKSLTDTYYPDDIHQWVTPDHMSLIFCVRIGARTKTHNRRSWDVRRGLGASVVLETLGD